MFHLFFHHRIGRNAFQYPALALLEALRGENFGKKGMEMGDRIRGFPQNTLGVIDQGVSPFW